MFLPRPSGFPLGRPYHGLVAAARIVEDAGNGRDRSRARQRVGRHNPHNDLGTQRYKVDWLDQKRLGPIRQGAHHSPSILSTKSQRRILMFANQPGNVGQHRHW
jgi:hypothetical protein